MADIELGGGTRIREFSKFQEHFSEYRIVVYVSDNKVREIATMSLPWQH
jgi:hypothetical protein